MEPRRQITQGVLSGVIPLGGEDLEPLVEETLQHLHGLIIARLGPLHWPHRLVCVS